MAPEAPEDGAPTAQERAEEGGTEVEMQEEGGSAQDGEDGDWGVAVMGGSCLFFSPCVWCGFYFFLSGGSGGKEIG